MGRIELNNYTSGDGLRFLQTSSNYIEHGNILQKNVSDPISIVIMARLNNITSNILCSYSDPLTENRWTFAIVGGRLAMSYLYNDGSTKSSTVRQTVSLVSGELYSFGVVGTGINTFRLFLNGQDIGYDLKSNNLPSDILYNTGTFHIGSSMSSVGNTYIDGSIFDAKIYNVALSDNDILKMHKHNSTIHPINGLKLSCNFSEKSGVTANDKSGNGYNGTLTNFANTSLGVNNQWVNYLENPITKY